MADSFAPVSAGNAYNMVIEADGSPWAWGSNENGQLGDGTAVDRSSPVQIIPPVDNTNNFTKDFIITVYNYGIYLAPEKTALKAGEAFYVDVMLAGNINYTQMAAEIAYDADLLEYAGYTNLQGWAASVTKSAANKVAVRSVPGINMVVGAPCSPEIRIVRLEFRVNSDFDGEGIDTGLSITSALVSPPGGMFGATVTSGKAVSVALQK
jgi:hypothetical protein